MTDALRLDDAGVDFGRARGLRGVSLTVAPGERIVLLGPSGAGKTTLLRAVAGLSPLAAGRIHIGGQDVTTAPPERRGAVYLHQTPRLFPHLNVAENVGFALRLRGRTDDGRVAAMLRTVQLADFGARRVQTLSGGQQQRVALARALAADAPLLLLDEPLAALDPELRDEVRTALEAAGTLPHRPALLLVSHDLDDAGLLGDRVGVLLDGMLAQLAPPAELFATPASLGVARYLGWPVIVPGTRETDGSVTSVLGRHRPGRDVGAGSGPVMLAARADALAVADDGTIAAELLTRRVRPHAVTGLVRVGEALMECLPGAATPGPVRLRVHAEQLHAFAVR